MNTMPRIGFAVCACALGFSIIVSPQVSAEAWLEVLRVPMAAEVERRLDLRDAYAFPTPHAVNAFAGAGAWSNEGLVSVWRYGVTVPEASSVGLRVAAVRLPDTATVIVTGGGQRKVYTASAWRHGNLWAQHVPGDTLNIELRLATADKARSTFLIDEVQVGYRGAPLGVANSKAYDQALEKKARSEGKAFQAGCDVNFDCARNGANGNYGRSVVGIDISNQAFCTATLINDVTGTKSFVVTAKHCVVNGTSFPEPRPANFTFFWNAVTPCGQPLQTASSAATQRTSGGVLRAQHQDLALIELDHEPPAGAQPHWVGFNATDSFHEFEEPADRPGPPDIYTGGKITGGVFGVHHGEGDAQQWVESDVARQRTLADGLPDGRDTWEVIHRPTEGKGRIEPGSSGSTLADRNFRIVGTLFGGSGDTACADSPDRHSGNYSRMGIAWNGDGTASTATRFWLDPSNTGNKTTNGRDRVVTPDPDVNLTITPSTARAASSDQALLQWTSENVTPGSCNVTTNYPGLSPGFAVDPAGTRNVSAEGVAAGTYNFTLTCAGEGATSATDSATFRLTSPPPPSAPEVNLNVTPATIDVGEQAFLNWTSTDGGNTLCTASGSWSGTKPLAGQEGTGTIDTAGPYTYTLTCTNSGGTGTDSVTLTVRAPLTLAFDAIPTTITRGESSRLSWNSPAASSCTASGAWTGAKPATGQEFVTPATAGTHTYTLRCVEGTRSVSETRSVVVNEPVPNAPEVTFTATPSTITVGNASTLQWSSPSASSCEAFGAWAGNQPTAGNATVSPPTAGTHSYGLRCSNAGGTTERTVTVQVNAPPPPPPPPPQATPEILSFTVTPQTVQQGGLATLTWTTRDVSACGGSGGWTGVKPMNGQEQVVVTGSGQVTFTLICEDSQSQVVSASRTVTSQPGQDASDPDDEEGGGGSLSVFALVTLVLVRRVRPRVHL